MVNLLKLEVKFVVLGLVLGSVEIGVKLFRHVIVAKSNLLLISRSFNAQHSIVVFLWVEANLYGL
jgi:hypothetical protein